MGLSTIAALIELLFMAIDKVVDLVDEIDTDDPAELEEHLERLFERAQAAKRSFRERLMQRQEQLELPFDDDV